MFKNLTAILTFTTLVQCIQPEATIRAGQAQEVVVYTSVDDVFARPIAEQFQKETGIKVNLVPDTEETKSTGLLNRLIAEKGRPRADVFWSGDPVRAAILKQKDISTPYVSKNAHSLPKIFSDSTGHWTGFSARARVILFNKNLVPKGQEPKSIMDLLDKRFKDKGCIANPLFGTSSMHAAALFEVMGEKKARKFFANLKSNGVRMLSSNGEVRRRVSAGDFVLGITDTDDAYQAIRDGKPVGVVFPDKGGMGTLIVPNAVVLIKNGPHLSAGKRFIDYLLSEKVEKMLAESDAAQIPVRPGSRPPRPIPSLDEIQPMKVNYSKIARRLDALSRGFLRQWAAANSR